MKRINLIKDVVFGIAIIFLLIYVFAQKGAIKSQEEKDHTSDSIQQEKKNEVAFADLNIAYVNIDSVIQKYDYYHVLNQKFVKKRQRLESEYQAKQQKLQERSNDLNYKMQKHLILQSEAEKVYTELMEESAELKKYGQQLTQQLAEEEQVLINKIMDRISRYLKEIKDQYNFQIVLASAQTSNLLYADPSLNITQKVINGLNKKYKEEQEKEKAK